ncbi:hypothetical protein BKA70DRAFT_325237 [Coprinopsis sp. MPI-PUGE-AT-0042]|nr:hypothetical protein BKA70DRAFT_325237 [Coprinopsis sp. MPI-PUGE-AT-0042]
MGANTKAFPVTPSPAANSTESADYMQTPPSHEPEHGPVAIHVDSGSESDTDSDNDLAHDAACGVRRRSLSRVTFRSRVRITSGLKQHRHGITPHTPYPSGLHGSTPMSSRSCSPSSSISAPLRFHSEETGAKPGWGTLGQRVSILAQRSAQKRRARKQARLIQRSMSEPCFAELQRSENTPLLGSSGAMYGTSYECDCPRCRNDEQPSDWPLRLFDYQWWWSSIRSAVTCRWLEDSDEEGLGG